MVIDIAVPINTGSTVVEGVRKHAEVSKACVCSDHPIDSIGVDVGFEETQVDDFCNLGTVVGGVVWGIPRDDRLQPGTIAQHFVDGKLGMDLIGFSLCSVGYFEGSEFGEKGNGSGRRYSDSGGRLPEIQVPVR